MRFVIVTGMSGAGKSTARKMLEDAGYFCVDNLPVSLIETFARLTIEEASEISKAALCIDIRSTSFDELDTVLAGLDERGYQYEILFLDAKDEVLLRRYKESRRNHPLAGKDRLEKGICEERKRLAFLKKRADYVIDTSDLLTRDLKEELDGLFLDTRAIQNLIVNIVSFGYKYGIPTDADLVFDVRFLPNPYYVEKLKHKTGLDADVRAYVKDADCFNDFMDKLTNLIRYLIPLYVVEGKTRLVIGVGCTGGHHRSVTVARELKKQLSDGDYALTLEHRDIDRG